MLVELYTSKFKSFSQLHRGLERRSLLNSSESESSLSCVPASCADEPVVYSEVRDIHGDIGRESKSSGRMIVPYNLLSLSSFCTSSAVTVGGHYRLLCVPYVP